MHSTEHHKHEFNQVTIFLQIKTLKPKPTSTARRSKISCMRLRGELSSTVFEPQDSWISHTGFHSKSCPSIVNPKRPKSIDINEKRPPTASFCQLIFNGTFFQNIQICLKVASFKVFDHIQLYGKGYSAKGSPQYCQICWVSDRKFFPLGIKIFDEKNA